MPDLVPESASAKTAVTESQWPLSCRLAGGLLIFTALAGAAAAHLVESKGFGVPQPGKINVFFYLYQHHERPFFALLGVAGLAAVFLGSRLRDKRKMPAAAHSGAREILAAVGVCALFVTLFARLGAHYFLHDVDLSMDEWTAGFQARIFERGQLTAPIDPVWYDFAFSMTPIFVEWKKEPAEWLASYLPVSAGIRTLFLAVDAERWANPVLGGLSVLCLGLLARRLWPEAPRRALLAATLLSSSTQFLFTSMTGYAYSAHLFLNVLWLLLYLRKDLCWYVLPWIGFLALGLHNPVPHALFAAPFLWRIFRSAGKAWRLYIFGIYGFSCVTWAVYVKFAGLLRIWLLTRMSASITEGHDLRTVLVPGRWLVQAMDWSLFFSWQTPLLALLAALALIWWRWLSPFGRDLAAGVLLTFAFYCIASYDQGHGWGYRYMYPVLGNVVLLAVFGASMVPVLVSWRALVVALLLPSVFQISLRAVQVESFVRPFARAFQYIQSYPAACVVIDPASGWYSQDLVRNDPFFQTEPRVLFANRISPDAVPRLETLCGGRIHWITAAELSALGLPAWPSRLLPAPESLRKESAP